MNNFWNNIFRYPRFFISSLTGLVLVILTPFNSLVMYTKLFQALDQTTIVKPAIESLSCKMNIELLRGHS